MQALAVGGGAVRLPIRKARLVSRIREVRDGLTQAQGEEPSNASVEEALNLDSGEMGMLLRGPGAQASLNEEEEGGDSLGLELSQTSAIPPADEDLIRHAFREEVEPILRLLKPREQEMVELRFGLGSEEPPDLGSGGAAAQAVPGASAADRRARQTKAQADGPHAPSEGAPELIKRGDRDHR